MGGPGYTNGKTYQTFDNFYPCVFEIDGKKYTSSEQCYQSLKFKDKEYAEKIRGIHNPNTCWSLGQSRDHELIPNLEQEKESLMYKANYAKFSQNQNLTEILTQSGYDPIIFTKSSPFWNITNGKILSKIREELRSK